MWSRWGWAALALPFLFFSAGCSGDRGLVTLRAGAVELRLTPEGRVDVLRRLGTEKDYLPSGQAPALLTFRVQGEDLLPLTATWAAGDSTLSLVYAGEIRATVRARTHPTHLSLTLTSVSDPEAAELALWGPYPTTLGETIGETVGVVRGEGFALGIQALNPKTLGGYPWNENDAMPQLDIFESGDYSDLSEEGKRYVLYRVEAAKPDTFGSTLQAYTRNRSHSRIIPNWGHGGYTAPPFDDGGVVGSSVALFGCSGEDALRTLGEIELAEGLPHPTIDGEWGKVSPSASAAYIIMPFSEATLDRAVDVTLAAGLRYLYHPEPFDSWGHFPLGEDFPTGLTGLRRAVERAEERGVMLGVHTLSNFITTDDAYVTPVPDPRLAQVGATALSREITDSETEIPIDDPAFFNQRDNDHLRAAVVGQEILRYREVSDGPPWRLLGTERGAFGTRTRAHAAGDTVAKLADHAYRVFLTDPELSVEVATNLATLFNQTGLRQISFDGLEGNRSTGMGNYGEILFTSTWYEALDPEIRSHYIADASRTSHYFWHIYTRMNWGEPWYAGFRESQTEYRMKNQAYFRRNYMPAMLGWFRMTPETSLEDMEWMLARTAAFHAGYGFVTSFETLEGNGRTEEILALMGLWEEARMAGAFSQDQKARMEDLSNEFHLEPGEEGQWLLTQIYATTHRYEARPRQPGEPSHHEFAFDNPRYEQPLGFILTATGGPAEGISLEVDGYPVLSFDGPLRAGEALVYEGGTEARLYSPQWHLLRTIPMESEALLVTEGPHRLSVDAGVGGEGSVKVELRLRGIPEPVTSQ